MDRAAALKLLESTHTFPSDHLFRVIVRDEAEEVERILGSLAALAGLASWDGRLERAPSSRGTYVSLRVSLPCAAAEHVLDVYAHLATLPGVVRYF